MKSVIEFTNNSNDGKKHLSLSYYADIVQNWLVNICLRAPEITHSTQNTIQSPCWLSTPLLCFMFLQLRRISRHKPHYT